MYKPPSMPPPASNRYSLDRSRQGNVCNTTKASVCDTLRRTHLQAQTNPKPTTLHPKQAKLISKV
ncbi:hypothetical protein, partial [Nostoc sp. 'Peltigera malacea cyanobiont' DB3992]|uniref:hypothetical protein n=1 Tax=Nostoc sp. 'Peltigera malacea cyanobiont' DB3992 TaxID=1206980 RepID=UPI00211E5F3B